jgi:hypothetical protein
MTYNLFHKHNDCWWGLGERTKEQLDKILVVADEVEIIDGNVYFKASKLYPDEPFFKAVIIK